MDGASAGAMTILVADDHAIVREGLKRLLESGARAWKVVEADSGFEALERLRRQRFDLATFDLSMPGMSGLDLLARVRELHPGMPVMILSMRDEAAFALRALQAGARGYVTKDTAGRDLVAAVEKIAAGGIYVSPSLADRVVLQVAGGAGSNALDRLSDRELEVLRRLVDGQRPSDIAQQLHLSIKTISSHKSRIQEKLNLDGTAALVRFGLESGLGSADTSPARER